MSRPRSRVLCVPRALRWSGLVREPRNLLGLLGRQQARPTRQLQLWSLSLRIPCNLCPFPPPTYRRSPSSLRQETACSTPLPPVPTRVLTLLPVRPYNCETLHN